MGDILGLVNDPEFKNLSLEGQRKLLLEITSRENIGKPTLPKDMQVNPSEGHKRALDTFSRMGTAETAQELGGGLFNPVASSVAALFGGAFPAKSAGEYGSLLAGGNIGEGLTSQLQKVSNPLARFFGSGMAGVAATEGQNALTEGVDRGANALGLQNKPEGDFFTKDPKALALGAGPSMATEALMRRLVSRNPKVVSNDLINQNQQHNISDLPQLSGLQAGETPGLLQALQEGQTKPPDLSAWETDIANKEARQASIAKRQREIVEASKFLDTQKAGRDTQKAKIDLESKNIKLQTQQQVTGIQENIDKLKLQGLTEDAPQIIEARANLQKAKLNGAPKVILQQAMDTVKERELSSLETKASTLQQQAEQRVAKGGGIQELLQNDAEKASATTNKTRLSKTQKSLGFENSQLKTEYDLLDRDINDLRTKASKAYPMDGTIRKIALESTTPDKLLENLRNTSADGIEQYKNHLESLPNGKASVSALKNAMLADFFKRSYDPQTKFLSNAPELMKTDGPFSFDKLNKLFGPEKTMNLQRAIDDIGQLAKRVKETPMQTLGRSSMNHLAWALPDALMYTRNVIDLPQALIGGGATALVTIGYPKLINRLLEDPKLADSFHKWATGGSAEAQTLANWPRVAAMLEKESNPVKDEQIPMSPPK